jgi:hypothetical protein
MNEKRGNLMKKYGIHLFMAVLLTCSALYACNKNSDKYDNEEGRRQISELAKIMGAKFPLGSKIVYAESNERNKEAYSVHIIYSPSPVEFNRPPNSKTLSQTPIEILKEASVTKDFEKLKNKWTYRYSGTIEKGDWRASQTNFETGSYLRVEQVFLYWQTN